MDQWAFAAPLAAVLALAFAFYLIRRISSFDPGNERMQEIAKAIQEGAMAFLNREFRSVFIFIVVVFLILLGVGYLSPSEEFQPFSAIAFLMGAGASLLAGYIGMTVATRANVRTAQAARSGLNQALQVAFAGGSVMGMSVVGLGLLGLSIAYYLFADPNDPVSFQIINGFALVASSVGLFARVGGGIYTKSADVGADLVGKVEAGLPEDGPRNPAVIADNVGDNVGDVAGMGADLFESYVGSIVATMAIGALTFELGVMGVLLPMMVAAAGVLATFIGTFFVRTGPKADPAAALR